jgi:hypothetical protein
MFLNDAHSELNPTSCERLSYDRLELSTQYSIALRDTLEEDSMNGIIYIVGLIVVIGVILSFFGLR